MRFHIFTTTALKSRNFWRNLHANWQKVRNCKTHNLRVARCNLSKSAEIHQNKRFWKWHKCAISTRYDSICKVGFLSLPWYFADLCTISTRLWEIAWKGTDQMQRGSGKDVSQFQRATRKKSGEIWHFGAEFAHNPAKIRHNTNILDFSEISRQTQNLSTRVCFLNRAGRSLSLLCVASLCGAAPIERHQLQGLFVTIGRF